MKINSHNLLEINLDHIRLEKDPNWRRIQQWYIDHGFRAAAAQMRDIKDSWRAADLMRALGIKESLSQ